MATIVLSVPHTGTRTLCHFLDRIGVIYRQYHSEPQNLEELSYEIKNHALIPVRDPLLCLTSTLARGGLENFDSILQSVILNFELLAELEKDFDFTYFYPDEEGMNKYEELHKKLGAGFPVPTDLDSVVGNIKARPTDYKTWGILSKALTPERKQAAIAELKAVRAHYGY